MNSAEWVAQAQAALLEDDPPPAVVFVPAAESARLAGVLPVTQIPAEEVPAPTWQAQHYAEYSRRLLAVYAACEGWPRARVAPLWPFVEASSRAFEIGAAGPWEMALAELERRTTAGAGSTGART